MTLSAIRPVIFLPGMIMPAAEHYAPLLTVLNHGIQPVLKELELYTTELPVSEYRLSMEVQGLRRVVEQHDFDGFHLVAYSGGGAVALAFVARYPELVTSLALVEPAVIPTLKWFQSEDDYLNAMERVMTYPSGEQMQEYMRLKLRSGVKPPPLEPWMAKRSACMQAMIQAFSVSKIEMGHLRRFQKPVYLAIGSLSNPIEERKAQTMARLFSDFQVEVYEGRHHFDPPQVAEPERFAKALLGLWERSEQA